jgi:hypothetical protein
MYPCHRRRFIDRNLLMLGALLLPASVLAADAHQAAKARPGDIVLLRNVSTRLAYRPAPPGMALMVDPSPRPETVRALSTEELSDADYTSLDATPVQGSSHGAVVGQVVGDAIGNLQATAWRWPWRNRAPHRRRAVASSSHAKAAQAANEGGNPAVL